MTRVQPQVPLYLYRNDRAQGGGGGQNEMGLMRPADFLFIYIIAVKKTFRGKQLKPWFHTRGITMCMKPY